VPYRKVVIRARSCLNAALAQWCCGAVLGLTQPGQSSRSKGPRRLPVLRWSATPPASAPAFQLPAASARVVSRSRPGRAAPEYRARAAPPLRTERVRVQPRFASARAARSAAVGAESARAVALEGKSCVATSRRAVTAASTSILGLCVTAGLVHTERNRCLGCSTALPACSTQHEHLTPPSSGLANGQPLKSNVRPHDFLPPQRSSLSFPRRCGGPASTSRLAAPPGRR